MFPISTWQIITAILIVLCIYLGAVAYTAREKLKNFKVLIIGDINMDISDFGLTARLETDCPLGELLRYQQVILRVKASPDLVDYVQKADLNIELK